MQTNNPQVQQLGISDTPPQWLLEACRRHGPTVSTPNESADAAGIFPKTGEMFCGTCTADAEPGSYVPWSPEHLAREIHKAMAQGLLALLKSKGAK